MTTSPSKVVIFKVEPGCELAVYVDGEEVARRRLLFPEIKRLVADMLHHWGARS